jgi:hypothetical protein
MGLKGLKELARAVVAQAAMAATERNRMVDWFE